MSSDNDIIDDDNNLDFGHPFLVLTDNNNICKTWESAFNDDSFKNEYNSFSDTEKNNISDNLQNRTCQAIKGVKQCFTANGTLETCNNLQKQVPKTITQLMNQYSNNLNEIKNKELSNIKSFVNEKDTLLTNLINQYTSRKDLLNTNQSYHQTIDSELNNKEKDIVELGDKIEKIENLKEFTTEDIKDERSNFFWYQSNNKTINMIIRILLCIYIILIIFLFSYR
jgi:hypothetical protein